MVVVAAIAVGDDDRGDERRGEADPGVDGKERSEKKAFDNRRLDRLRRMRRSIFFFESARVCLKKNKVKKSWDVMKEEMVDLLRTHGFIHIPKTGGTSIESLLNASQVIIKRNDPYLLTASPWHLPVDVYEATYKKPYMRPSFCVVREPRDRLDSCIAWTQLHHIKFDTPIEFLPAIFANGRLRVKWNEERVHRMPQSWYVWAEDGRVTCDCVVAFEKLSALTSVHTNKAKSGGARYHHNYTYPANLYAMDSLLHQTALAAPSLCYRPPPLSRRA